MRWRRGLVAVACCTVAASAWAGAAGAAITPLWNAGAGALGLATSSGDAVAVSCAGGNVAVTGVSFGTPVPCASVVTLSVVGDAAANTIDVSGVTHALFPGLTGGRRTAPSSPPAPRSRS